jgi:hypothetical protein
MKRFSLGLVLLLGLVPLAACNQNNNKAPAVHERHERGLLEGRHERDGFEGRRGGRGRLRQACADDITKYCSGMDRPRLKRQCLQGHLDQLSADCKTFIENRRAGRRRRDF